MLFLSIRCIVSAEDEKTILRMNHGIQFSERKYIFVADWHHKIRLDIPLKFDFNNHTNITLCKSTFFSEKGCPLTIAIQSYLNHVHKDLKRVHDTLEGLVPYVQFDTHNKRGLTYVGDLRTHVFSIATEGQLDILKKHINNIVKKVNDVTSILSHSQGEMTSFIYAVNEEMKNFDEFVKDSINIRQRIIYEIQSYDKETM